MNESVELRDSKIFGNSWLWPKHDAICWDFFNKPLTSSVDSNNPATFPHDVLPYVSTRDCVIQAGGNSGLYAKIYSGFFEKVYTFEPDATWFTCLTHNVPEKNVYKFQCCLGNDSTGLNVATPTWSKENYGAIRVSGPGNVPQLQIDSFNAAPNLIHLDIEGYELFALQGAINTIEKHKPVIVLEINDTMCQMFGYRENDIDAFLASFGYSRKRTWVEDAPYGTKDVLFA